MRGQALGELELVEHAYVLCDGDRSSSIGRMADLGSARRRRRGARRARALRRPGPRRLPHAPGVRRRPRRGVLAPRGRRELRGAPRGGRRHPLDRARDPRGGRGRPRRGGRAAPRLDAARGHDDLRGQVGLRARPRHRARLAARRSAPQAGSRPGSARTRSRPSTRTPTRTWTSSLAEVLPEAAQLAEAADVFLERGAFDAAQARRYLEACRDAGPRAAPPRRPVHRGGRDPARDRARRALGRPPRGNRPRRRRARSRASDVVGVLLPASALFLGRPMPPGARARGRRRGRRARDRLQPRQRVLREPAARLLARGHAAPPQPGGGARGRHGQRRPRARPRRTASAGSRPATPPTSSLLDAPDWRYLAYHLGGDVVAGGRPPGRRPLSRAAY